MKKYLLHIFLFFCITQFLYSQEDGVVAYSLPVRNSLKFNKYAINPTFSFVREQNKYISFTNKRQWTQFENAPQTYLFSYSGRFNENNGVGIGLFQQNYGVLTTFGGVLNFAHNAVLDRNSNLTFGMNVGFYKSGINQGSVVTNFPDPSLNNIPSNSLITVNPGINYGTTFLDFGVSLNNIVLYNLKTSELIKDNPEQIIRVHAMYTGYLNSRGFFDQSKFSGLIRSDLSKDKTTMSGILMLSIPKGMWAQVGYNTLYGASAGIGFSVSQNIALEYNFEKAVGDLSGFGSSHEITLAYKFNKNEQYSYGEDDTDEGALIQSVSKPKRVATKPKNTTRVKPLSTAERKLAADRKAKEEADAKAKLATEQAAKAKAEEDARIKLAADTKAKEEAAAKAKLAADTKAKEDAIAKAKEEADAKAKLATEQAARTKAEEAARIKLAADTKAKEEAAAKAKLAADAKAKEAADAKAKEDAIAKAKLDAEQNKAKEEEAARLKLLEQARADEAAKIKLAQEQLNKKVETKPLDDNAKSIDNLTKIANVSKVEQEQLLSRLSERVAIKKQDLKDLKKENDLSEQGIVSAPKEFKSISAENALLESLKVELDDAIKAQNLKIADLENLYNKRQKNAATAKDEISMVYLNEIEIIKNQQSKTINAKASLVSELEEINKATEIERKRRIKRAAYDNETDRYNKERTALNVIKQNTPLSTTPLKEEDFDSGQIQNSNIQILKDIKNIEKGYYMVVAIHDNIAKRDEFLTKAVAAGESNINFFYDVNTSKYYIYYEKYEDLNSAQNALQSKGSKPYNGNMSMVKIEN